MCCMRLHNLCIDARLSEFSKQTFHPADFAATRAAVLQRPQFDRDGIPVDLLTWHGEEGRERGGGQVGGGTLPQLEHASGHGEVPGGAQGARVGGSS